VRRELAVLAVAMALPTVAAAVYFVGLASTGAEPGSNSYLQTAYSASKIVQFLLPVVWLAIADRTALRLQRLSIRDVGLGLAFGIVVALGILALYYGWLTGSPLLAGLPGAVHAKLVEFGAATPLRFWLFAGFICVIHSLLEEYYWRWFVYGRLRHCRVPRALALVLGGLAFMGHHVVILGVYFPGRFWPAVAPFSLGIAVGGIVWAWLYERSGSIVGPWLSHLTVDAALMVVGYELVFGGS
jgi:membrane protease YdiL (CAAX protease family)